MNKAHTLKLYEKNGDIYLEELKTGKIQQLTNTLEREANPLFSGDENKVIYTTGGNLFSMGLNGGGITQLTNFSTTAAAAARFEENSRGVGSSLNSPAVHLRGAPF